MRVTNGITLGYSLPLTGWHRKLRPNTEGNNSVYYNILLNISGAALRSKAMAISSAGRSGSSGGGATATDDWGRGGGGGGGAMECSWRWENNVVAGAGVGFETQYMGAHSTPSSTILPHGDCVLNNIFACFDEVDSMQSNQKKEWNAEQEAKAKEEPTTLHNTQRKRKVGEEEELKEGEEELKEGEEELNTTQHTHINRPRGNVEARTQAGGRTAFALASCKVNFVHHAGWIQSAPSKDDYNHNMYWPDGLLFCSRISLNRSDANCTNFNGWVNDGGDNSAASTGNGSMVANPMFQGGGGGQGHHWWEQFRPLASSSPAVHAGAPSIAGAVWDIDGSPVTDRMHPDLGAFAIHSNQQNQPDNSSGGLGWGGRVDGGGGRVDGWDGRVDDGGGRVDGWDGRVQIEGGSGLECTTNLGCSLNGKCVNGQCVHGTLPSLTANRP